jgi:drug/metabolite transporter (DMT)-like permease
MVLVTLLWSTAGVVTRYLDSAQSFEITFWRSTFNALALSIGLTIAKGWRFWLRLAFAPKAIWLSGVCWACMFTAFMVALTLTSVASVLVTLSIGPLVTALFARLFLHHRLSTATWIAIFSAGAGIGWMFWGRSGEKGMILGTMVALVVPLASAFNFTLLQFVNQRKYEAGAEGDDEKDMLPAVFIGALFSSLFTLLLACPLHGSSHDIALLCLLGVFQLALPCFLLICVATVLPAPEIALIGLLEIVFGIGWVWICVGEQPSLRTLEGGVVVVSALIFNEFSRMRNRPNPL